ncbi:DUF6541 family protein [Microbacterium sp. NPDC055455]
MSWLSLTPTAAVTLLVLAVPGGLTAWLLGFRGLRLAAAAPGISVAIIAVAALVSPMVGSGWGPVPVIALTVIAAASAYAWSRWAGTPAHSARRPDRSRWWVTAVAFAIPAAVITHLLVRSIGDPEYLSQRYDNFFHLNAVQYVIDTANASPLWIGSMTSPEGLPFYPSGWHAVVSLIVMLTGASVVAATNAAVFAIAAAVWPLGALFLARTLLGRSRITTVSAGVLSAAFPAFPYLPLHYGVLYPLFLGLSIVPAALAFAYLALRPGRVPRRQDAVLLVVLLVPGLGVAHPGALLALLALSVPIVLAFALGRLGRARRPMIRAAWVGGILAYAVIGCVILIAVRPPASQIYWPVLGTLPAAIGEVVSASVYQYPAAPVVAVLSLVGVYSAIRRPTYARWIVLSIALIGGVLYVIVAGSTSETLRMWLTAPWYNNAPRLASVWAIGALPLAALGGAVLVRFLTARLPARGRRLVGTGASVVVFGIVLTLLSQGPAMRQAAADIEFTYQLRPGGPILSPDEYKLMRELDDYVPEDAVIAANPWTGASFAYGISGRAVLMPHLLMDETAAARVINTGLDTDGDSPEMCEALEETGVRFVLDFGGGDFQEHDGDYSGLDHLERSDDVELVVSEGDARLYRVVSCGLRR